MTARENARARKAAEDLLLESGRAGSRSDARRLIAQGVRPNRAAIAKAKDIVLLLQERWSASPRRCPNPSQCSRATRAIEDETAARDAVWLDHASRYGARPPSEGAHRFDNSAGDAVVAFTIHEVAKRGFGRAEKSAAAKEEG